METTKFFFYGIFLSPETREKHGMPIEAQYGILKDYATFPVYKGSSIVKAKAAPDQGVALTGLVVNVPDSVIPKLDKIEAGYDRDQVWVNEELVQIYLARPAKQKP